MRSSLCRTLHRHARTRVYGRCGRRARVPHTLVQPQRRELVKWFGKSRPVPDGAAFANPHSSAPMALVPYFAKVSEFLRDLETVISLDSKRDLSLKPNINMIFVGNPGVGKRRTAQMVSTMLHKKGFLWDSDVISLHPVQISHSLTNGTQSMSDIINDARGRVVYVPDLFSFYHAELGSDDGRIFKIFLHEIRAVDDVVVVAGCNSSEINLLQKKIPDLVEYFPLRCDFEILSVKELEEIALRMYSERGLIVSPDAKLILPRLIEFASHKTDARGANATIVSNMVTKSIFNQSKRIANLSTSQRANLDVIEASDLEVHGFVEQEPDSIEKVFSELNSLEGLQQPKMYLKQLYDLHRVNEWRASCGLPPTAIGSNMNAIFFGQPGCGKKRIARLSARLLSLTGGLQQGQMVVVRRPDFVGYSLARTVEKTMEMTNAAMGGILLIEDAHLLVSNTSDAEGAQSVSVLLDMIWANPRDLMVILCGPFAPMQRLLELQPHLQAVFSHKLYFDNLSDTHILQLVCRHLSDLGYVFEGHEDHASMEGIAAVNGDAHSSDAHAQLLQIIHKNPQAFERNGLSATKLSRRLIAHQAQRLSMQAQAPTTRDVLATITLEDVLAVAAEAESAQDAFLK